MRIILFAILIALFTTTSWADEYVDIQPVDFEFSGLHLGQAPPPEMVCVSGQCLGPLKPEQFTAPISIYQKDLDITQLGGIPISHPLYLFHRDRLFQISFQLECRPEETESCAAKVQEYLGEAYGVTDLGTDPIRDEEFVKGITTQGGAQILILDYGSHSSIRITDEDLAVQVRMATNPNYLR